MRLRFVKAYWSANKLVYETFVDENDYCYNRSNSGSWSQIVYMGHRAIAGRKAQQLENAYNDRN